MKEDVAVVEVWEDLGSVFNELGSLDNVNKESDGCSICYNHPILFSLYVALPFSLCFFITLLPPHASLIYDSS
jgi:hypothetical protein